VTVTHCGVINTSRPHTVKSTYWSAHTRASLQSPTIYWAVQSVSNSALVRGICALQPWSQS